MLLFVSEPTKIAGHAFISYVREDSHRIDQLQLSLEAAGIPVWRDTEDLWPGEDWRTKIREAITGNALVFIACFSRAGLGRHRSYQNEELVLAIEQLRLRRPDDPWLIPVRLDECEIPDRDLGGGRTLTSIQRADLFGDRSDEEVARLIAAVLRILGRRSGTAEAALRQGKSSSSYAKDDLPLLKVLPIRAAYGLQSIEWQPGGELLATGNGDGTVTVVSIDDGGTEILSTVDPSMSKGILTDSVHHLVRWSSDGASLLSIPESGAGAGPAVWKLKHGHWTPTNLDMSIWRATDAAWSDEGDPYVLLGKVALNCLTGKKTVMDIAADLQVCAGRFSPSMRFVGICAWDHNEVLICEVSSGRLVRTLKDCKGRVRSVSWSYDGKHLSADDSEETRVWNVFNGLMIESMPAGRLYFGAQWPLRDLRQASCWSRRTDAVAFGGQVIEWAANGHKRAIVDLGSQARFVEWSYDTRIVAVSEFIEVWDTTTRNPTI